MRSSETALEAEVLVIGSGAGGAPTAALLAAAGFDVLVLEEGAMVPQGDVVPFSLEQMDRQYRAGGVTAAIGFPSIAYTEGCCVGGTRHVVRVLASRPLPVAGEYARLVRSLTYAYVWETWPDTTRSGAPIVQVHR